MKKKMTVLCGLLMAVLVTAYSVSGTYAKYISSMDTTDTARVAHWGFKLGETDKLNIFKAAYGAGNEIASAANEDGTHDLVVAPGASGKINIDVDGSAEVAYTLSVTADVDNEVLYTNGHSPIMFRLGTGAWTELTTDNLQAALVTELGADSYKAGDSVKKSVVLEWRWAFDATDLTEKMGLALDDIGIANATELDKQDTKLGRQFAGTTMTPQQAFEAIISTDTYKDMATEGDWKTIEDVKNASTKATIQTLVDDMVAKSGNGSEANITITLNITATQVEPTA